MRVFRQSYSDRHGKRRKSRKWYVELKDHNSVTRRLPGFTDKAATTEYGRRLEKLVALRTLRQPDDPDTAAWVERLPAADRKRLAKFGLLDPQAAAHAKPLADHVTDFVNHLEHSGRTENYTKLVRQRVTDIVEHCGFRFVADVTAK